MVPLNVLDINVFSLRSSQGSAPCCMELRHLFHSFIANTVSNFTQDKMEAKEFRKVGKELIDFMADHIEGVSLHPVVPSVKPGTPLNLYNIDRRAQAIYLDSNNEFNTFSLICV